MEWNTSCLIVIKDKWSPYDLLTIFTAHDGQPENMGMSLYHRFKNTKLVYPAPISANLCDFANGMQCLAAQVVEYLKKEVGNCYIYPADSRNKGEQYIYTLYEKDNIPRMSVSKIYSSVSFYGSETIFNNEISEFENFMRDLYNKED